MSQEDKELAAWLRQALDHNHPMPASRPAQLRGASFEVKLDDPTPSVRVDREDGSRFAVMVLGLGVSRARREELDRAEAERAAERRAAEAADPALKEKRIDSMRRLAEIFRELHVEEHRGRFETCRDDMCEMARDLASIYAVDEDAADLDTDSVN